MESSRCRSQYCTSKLEGSNNFKEWDVGSILARPPELRRLHLWPRGISPGNYRCSVCVSNLSCRKQTTSGTFWFHPQLYSSPELNIKHLQSFVSRKATQMQRLRKRSSSMAIRPLLNRNDGICTLVLRRLTKAMHCLPFH